MDIMDNKSVRGSWLEVEMNETVDLLRKKLEKMNNMEACQIDHADLRAFKDLYKTLYYVFSIDKAMK